MIDQVKQTSEALYDKSAFLVKLAIAESSSDPIQVWYSPVFDALRAINLPGIVEKSASDIGPWYRIIGGGLPESDTEFIYRAAHGLAASRFISDDSRQKQANWTVPEPVMGFPDGQESMPLREAQNYGVNYFQARNLINDPYTRGMSNRDRRISQAVLDSATMMPGNKYHPAVVTPKQFQNLAASMGGNPNAGHALGVGLGLAINLASGTKRMLQRVGLMGENISSLIHDIF